MNTKYLIFLAVLFSASSSHLKAQQVEVPKNSSLSIANHQDKKELSDELKARLRKVQELTKLASAKDWDAFIALSKDVLSMPDYLKSSTLTAAIRDKAPAEVFSRLLEMGAKFEYSHVFRAVNLNDLPFLKQLIALGLDIHAVSRNRENALNTLVNTLASREVFAFLLQNNVEILPFADGQPILTRALSKSVKTKKAVYFAFKLMQYGDVPQEKDFALVNRIREENSDSYQLIARNIPELVKNQ